MSTQMPRLLLLSSLTAFLAACAGTGDLVVPEPLRPPQQTGEYRTEAPPEEVAVERQRFQPGPVVPPLRTTQSGAAASASALSGEPINISFENVPLPMLINEVYGNLLGIGFEIAPELQQKQDLVTLRIPKPMPPAEVDRTVRQVLANYGVAVQVQGDLLRFVIAGPRGSVAGEPPLLVTGRALPSVPESHRPVFQIVPVHVVTPNDLRGWLVQAFQGFQVDIQADNMRGTLTLRGRPDDVKQVLSALEVLDQPAMRGRHSLRIEPLFRSPEALSKDLTEVLTAQGYTVSNRAQSGGSLLVMPIAGAGSVLVFATEPGMLKLVRQWVTELDRAPVEVDGDGLFIYEAQNTAVDNLSQLADQLLRGSVASAAVGQAQPAATAAPIMRGSVVVDPARNTLIFQGSAKDWGRLLPLLKDMDKPAKLALIEVTIAEVTLSDDVNFGIDWALRNFGPDNFKGDLSTGLGVGTGAGLSWLPVTNSGNFRATLNAAASTGRVSILSTPRLMVRSGSEASINVGTDVPIITSSASTPDVNAIIQQVQYRETGTLLSLRPVIYAGGRIDLEVNQEVSEAQVNRFGGTSSPTILNRSLKTSLSLSDGESVLLGGLISTSRNRTANKVPLLGDVPVVGHLFRSDSDVSGRTELLVLITSYVINNGKEARDITEAFRRQLNFEAEEAAPKQ